MALRNIDINEILEQCRHHNSHIIYSNYPAAYRYIRRQQKNNCLEINNKQPSSILQRRRDLIYNPYSRNNFRDPMDSSAISNDLTQIGDLIEPFIFNKYKTSNDLFILLFIIVLVFFSSIYIYN